MTDVLARWAARLRSTWLETLLALRSGVFGTSELRNGRRVDTTMETIVQRKKDLLELNAVIARHDEDRKEALKNDAPDHHVH